MPRELTELEAEAMLVIAECQTPCADEPDVVERLRKAMKAARDHHMVTDEVTQFRGAVGAVLLDPLTTDEEKRRLEREINVLRALGAAQSGVPVNFGALLPEEDYEPIGILKIWHETAI